MSNPEEVVAADQWEGDYSDDVQDGQVRRMAVPGGWLYQVGICTEEDETAYDKESKAKGTRERKSRRWSEPVFVPTPSVRA